MTDQKFIEDVLKTENQNFEEMRSRLTDPMLRILHSAIGMSTEANELLDMVKKHIFYGKEFDVTNAVEESGDILYYMAVEMDVLEKTFQEATKKVIAKLEARYGDKFSKERAINRDLDAERRILEKQ